jgi:hypothetical protein
MMVNILKTLCFSDALFIAYYLAFAKGNFSDLPDLLTYITLPVSTQRQPASSQKSDKGLQSRTPVIVKPFHFVQNTASTKAISIQLFLNPDISHLCSSFAPI